jgi:hypothetical protein
MVSDHPDRQRMTWTPLCNLSTAARWHGQRPTHSAAWSWNVLPLNKPRLLCRQIVLTLRPLSCFILSSVSLESKHEEVSSFNKLLSVIKSLTPVLCTGQWGKQKSPIVCKRNMFVEQPVRFYSKAAITADFLCQSSVCVPCQRRCYKHL